MSLLRKISIGAGIGATAGVTLHFVQKSKEKGNETLPEIKYKYIEKNSEMRFHVGELLSFKSSDTEMVLESIQDTLDRLLAIEALCETSTRESVKASWPITAQHYVQDIVDAMVLLRTNITQQQQVIMDMHIEEIKTFLANTVYNIDMQVQNLLN